MKSNAIKKGLLILLSLVLALSVTACSTAGHLLSFADALTERFEPTSSDNKFTPEHEESENPDAPSDKGGNGTDSNETAGTEKDDQLHGAQIATPTPTLTPTPTPTPTPKPVSTPKPTATPTPTSTPKPTSTPPPASSAAAESEVEPYISVSANYVELTDSTVTVFITLVGYDSIVINEPWVVDCTWGDLEDNCIPFYITPVEPGSGTIEIYTEDDKLYTTIDVVVEGDLEYEIGTLSVNPSSVTLDGQPKNITITYTGSGHVYLSCYDDNIDWEYGEWDGDTMVITLVPTRVGNTVFQVYTDDLCVEIDVYVESVYDPGELYTDTSHLELSNETVLVYVTLIGHDSINVSYDADVVDCYWGEWVGDVIELYVEPIAPGSGWIELYTDDYALYTDIYVTVE